MSLTTILVVLLLLQLFICIISGMTKTSDFWEGFFEAMFWVWIMDAFDDGPDF